MSDAVDENSAPRLSPCPCGAEAVWYRVVLAAAHKPPGQALKALAADDFYEDLCEECFRSAVPQEDRAGWKRLAED